MTPEFSNLVDPVFQRVLSLLDRLQAGERPELQTERNEIRNEIEEAEKTASAPGSRVRLDDFRMAKEALVYWTDEVLTDAWPDWKDVLLEVEYYGPPRKRAWKFYVVGEQQARHASPDVAEVWYLALVMGFHGDIRDAFRTHLNREMPGGVEDEKEARRIWIRQLEKRIRPSTSAEMAGEPLYGHVAPLYGGTILTTGLLVCTFLLGLLGVIFLWRNSSADGW